MRECLLSGESDGATTKDFIRAVPAKKKLPTLLSFRKDLASPTGFGPVLPP